MIKYFCLTDRLDTSRYLGVILVVSSKLFVTSSSSSCRADSTDIPNPLTPLLPIVHRLRQVFWTTFRILT